MPSEPASPDTAYALRRSEVEAIRSIASGDVRAAAAHEELCLRYVEQAVAGLTSEDAPPVPE